MCPKFEYPSLSKVRKFTCQVKILIFAQKTLFRKNCEWLISLEIFLAFQGDLIFFVA